LFGSVEATDAADFGDEHPAANTAATSLPNSSISNSNAVMTRLR